MSVPLLVCLITCCFITPVLAHLLANSPTRYLVPQMPKSVANAQITIGITPPQFSSVAIEGVLCEPGTRRSAAKAL